MNIVDFSLKRPVAMTMIILFLIVMGLFSYSKIQLDMLPRIDLPFITVSTAYPGASPQNVETLISKPIEDAVAAVTGIDILKSDSLEGFSNVIIQFKEDVDVNTVAADVREKVSAIRNKLPRDAKDPVILKLDINALPIMAISISADRPVERIYSLAKDIIKDEIQQVAGVADVEIIGGREREINILLKHEVLKEYGLSPYTLASLIAQKTVNLPSGHITRTQREYSVRLEGEFASVQEIQEMEIPMRNGKPLKIKDLGDVRDTYEEFRQGVTLNAKPCVAMIVKKQSDANTVKTAKLLQTCLSRLQEKLPGDVQITVVRDRSQFIVESVDDSNGNIITGIAITAGVLFLFLHSVKLTLIALVSIPVSIVATYSLMYFFGFSLNMMTLMALGISVGILVSNAVVVLENIFVLMQKGKSPHEAALEGTNEILVAVAGATLTNVVVFVPIAFMEGMVGRFFYEFGLTVAFATFVSLLMAFTITPLSAAIFLSSGDADLSKKGWLGRTWDRGYTRLSSDYKVIVAWCLTHKTVTIGAGVVFTLLTLTLVPYIGFEFIAEPDQREFDITVEMPPGASLARTSDALNQIERNLKSRPEIKTIFTKLGKTESMVGGSSLGTHIGEVSVKLLPQEQFPLPTDAFIQQITPLMAMIPDVKLNMRKTGLMGTNESPMQIDITGDDPKVLEDIGAKVLDITRKTPGAMDVLSSMKEGKPEWKIIPIREQLARFGMTESFLALNLRSCFEGIVMSTYREKDDEYDIRVKLTEDFRNNLHSLKRLNIISPQGVAVPLIQLARIEETVGKIQIKRKSRNKLINISANVAGRSLGEVVKDIRNETDKISLPVGFNIAFEGMVKRMNESFSNLLNAMVLAVILTYLLLAGLLESFIHPFTILISFPMAFGGIILGLFFTGQTLSMFSLMAVVMLVGIVVNNGILLLKRYRLLEAEGKDLLQSIVDGSPLELRPIVMTMIAAVSAMIPQAMGLGAGGEMRASMATVSVGGLLVSSTLSLFLIPVLYFMVESAKAWLSAALSQESSLEFGVGPGST